MKMPARGPIFLPSQPNSSAAGKPMNCTSHCLLFAGGTSTYRDLPLRLADFGLLHRYERSGVTSGLTRVRSYAQDEAHFFCNPDQIEGEVSRVLAKLFAN